MTDEDFALHCEWFSDFYENDVFPKLCNSWQSSHHARLGLRTLKGVTMDTLTKTIKSVVSEFASDFCEQLGSIVAKDDEMYRRCEERDARYTQEYERYIEENPDGGLVVAEMMKRLKICGEREGDRPRPTVFLIGGGFVNAELTERVTAIETELGWKVRGNESDGRGRMAVLKGLQATASSDSLKHLPHAQYYLAIWAFEVLSVLEHTLKPGELGRRPERTGRWKVVVKKGDPMLGESAIEPFDVTESQESKIALDHPIQIYRFAQDPTALGQDHPGKELFADLTLPKDEHGNPVYPSGTNLSDRIEQHGRWFYQLAYSLKITFDLHGFNFEVLLPPTLKKNGDPAKLLPEVVLTKCVVDMAKFMSCCV